MSIVKCDICGAKMGNSCRETGRYSCNITPHMHFIWSRQPFIEYENICEDCAADLFNYIRTMKKTARAKL